MSIPIFLFFMLSLCCNIEATLAASQHSRQSKAQPGEIFVKGLAELKTPNVKRILQSDLEDLTAAVLQDSRVEKAAARGLTGDYNPEKWNICCINSSQTPR